MLSSHTDHWWSRPCGGREVAAMALPLVISMGTWSLMNFVDRMFLLWFSTESMAAAMPAGMLSFTVICFPLGVAMYVNTFVAQYEGAGRPQRSGAVVWQGIRVGLYSMPLLLATIPLAPLVFRWVGHEPQLASLETVYYQVLCFGAGAQVVGAAMSSFFAGQGRTRVVMAVDCTAALLNVPLDYAWIFGHWGLPALGIEGAAWATVTSQWVRVAVYAWLMMRPAVRVKYRLIAGRRFDAPLMRRLLYYGGPSGLQLLIEVAAFTVFLLLVGRLGPLAAAATSLAFNVNGVAWVPLMGLGIAVTTLVGQQLGRDQPELAARAAWTSFWMAEAYLGFMAVLYFLTPDLFLMGHASGTSPHEFAELRDATVMLLRFVAAYSLFDGMNMVFVSAIKGAGDTRFILVVSLVLSPLPVLVCWVGITLYGAGLVFCWTVLTAWVCVLGLIYLARFLRGRWQQMRVIEPDLAADAVA